MRVQLKDADYSICPGPLPARLAVSYGDLTCKGAPVVEALTGACCDGEGGTRTRTENST